MVENFNKYTCDSCGYEIATPVGRAPKGWSSSDTYGDLCTDCLSKLKGFFRDFYGDETKCCKLVFDELNRGIY